MGHILRLLYHAQIFQRKISHAIGVTSNVSPMSMRQQSTNCCPTHVNLFHSITSTTSLPMNNELALQISEQRDDICEWMMTRFRELMSEERIDDALHFADEWFEWMDPEGYINETTHFYNEDELLQLYLSLPETDR